MDSKSHEVRETLLGSQDGLGDEKKDRMNWIPCLQSKDKQCSLEKGHKHGWKPLTMSASVLFSFAFVSFVLATILEVLAQQSQRNGGLALSPSVNDIPTYAKFGYLFLPTIVAVIYSLLWSWVDLDVKRIQPWLEMSRPDGATASQSIFLDYPYDFVAFAPIRAARRRHWAVFYSGLVMVIIFWLITPLQSAILGSGTVNVRNDVSVTSSQVLRPSSDQIYDMDQSILNEGYAVTWLKQSLPPFTTAGYTLLPFKVESDTTRATSTNWTGSTVKYWTEPECWPAEVYPGVPYYSFVDGRGCNASDLAPYGAVPLKGQPYRMQYFGYYASDFSDYWLSIPCKKVAVQRFLATWARFETQQDVRGVFCETNYYKQEVNATVSATTNEPIEGSVVPTGPREKLLPNEFNTSSFDFLLGAGVSPVETSVKRDYAFNHLLEQHDQIRHFGLTWPSSPLVGFAVGSAVNSQNLTTLDAFENETYLAEAFQATHKMLFSLAFRRMLNTSTETTTVGQMDFERYGIIVSRLYSALVEGLLIMVGVFSMLLWWHGKRAPSRLSMDPASIESLINICQNSSAFLAKFSGKGCFSNEKLQESFDGTRFQLICGCQSRSGKTVIQVVDAPADLVQSQRISLPVADPAHALGHYSPFKPLALRREVGAAVTLAMAGVVVALVYLRSEEQRIGGLIRPTNNFEVLQILENYIPTVFATLLEPYWVLVNRLLCILQPFKDLWSGQRPAKGSIKARYTSVPPQFVLWRAAKSGHLVLVAICMLALLSNLLAVGLGGLFNERPVIVDADWVFQQTMKPTFNNDTVNGDDTVSYLTGPIYYETPMYIAMNNYSQGTQLPPWVNKDYYFQPFSADVGQDMREKEYTARTRGFGVSPQCSTVDPIKTIGLAPVINHTYARNGQTVPGCDNTFQNERLNLNKNMSEPSLLRALSLWPATAETVGQFYSKYPNKACGVPLVLGWSRSPNTTLGEESEMETWTIICEPIFTTSMFDVTVDSKGYVLNAVQVSESSSTLDAPLTTNNTDTISTYVNDFLSGRSTTWHNDSYATDWMNYLIKIQPEGAAILDPHAIPNTTALLPRVEQIYRQLYALTLSLNTNFFDNHTEPITITGTRRSTEIRIFMDPTALVISLSVLGLNIAVAVALYGCTIKHFLPRMPTNIASLLAYLAPSRAARGYDGAGSLDGATFSFGRYVGDDGRAHVGIEMDPYVVPVKLSALKKGDTQARTGLMRRVLGRGKPGKGDTWL